MTDSSTLTLRARYLFPVQGEVISNGWLRLRDGRIEALGDDDTSGIDLGNVAIVPGFVNAHTHLELSSLPNDLWTGSGTEDQLDWLRRMIAWRRQSGAVDWNEVLRANIDESLASGTTTVADITTRGMSWEPLRASSLRGTVFCEVLGLKRERALEMTDTAYHWLATVKPEVDQGTLRIRSGLSPHAPYSTAGWIYQHASKTRLPLSTHLAEMPEESVLLASREGGLRTLLEELGAWDQSWEPLGSRPADYVRKGELRHSDWLIAHGNYLEPSDYWQLRPHAAPNGQRVAIAYCPRTHARFGHTVHPFRQMLKREIVVCLGTDSKATAASLSILDEMRFLKALYPDIGGDLLLTMATLFGAWVLRLDTVCGTLAPGKAADLALISLPDRDAADPHSLLLDSSESVAATMIAGEVVYRSTGFRSL